MKLGFILPSVVSLPSDLEALRPPGTDVLIVTLNGRNGLPGEAAYALEALPRAVDLLLDESVEAIMVMGTPVAARRGFAADCAALEQLVVRRAATPIASSLRAITQALAHIGAQRPIFVTQYNAALNEALVTYCRDAGLKILAIEGLGAANAAAVNALSETDYETLARDMLARHPEADALVLCARLSLIALAGRLEAEFSCTIFDQSQSSMWWAAEQLGLAVCVVGGRLGTSTQPCTMS